MNNPDLVQRSAQLVIDQRLRDARSPRAPRPHGPGVRSRLAGSLRSVADRLES